MHQLPGNAEETVGEPHDGDTQRNKDDRHAQQRTDEPEHGRKDPQYRTEQSGEDPQYHSAQAP